MASKPRSITVAAFFLVLAVLPVRIARCADAVGVIATALRSGHFEEALKLADQALAADPGNSRLLTLRGLALTKTGSATEALRSFNRALEISPGYIPALEGAAELEFKKNDPTAIQHLDELIKLRPDDQTAHAMRGVMAWRAGDCATAIQHFGRAQEPIASQPPALYEYGSCLAKLQKMEAAENVFKRLYRLVPDQHRPVYALASIQISNEHYQDAIETLRPLISQQNADDRGLQLASTAYEALGNTPQAVKMLRQAIVAAPGREDLYVQFASLCLQHKSFQVGIDMLNAGLTKLPHSAKLYLARGVMYVQQGNYESADRDFATAEIFHAPEETGISAQALSQLQANHLDEALQTVNSHIKRYGTDSFLYYLLAEILTKRGAQPGTADFARAIAAAQHAVQLKPDFVLARDVLSRLYLDSGKTQEAIEECRRTLSIDPSDETALYRLIRALKATGKQADAMEIPRLTARLTEARRAAQKKEADASRYRLVEETP